MKTYYINSHSLPSPPIWNNIHRKNLLLNTFIYECREEYAFTHADVCRKLHDSTRKCMLESQNWDEERKKNMKSIFISSNTQTDKLNHVVMWREKCLGIQIDPCASKFPWTFQAFEQTVPCQKEWTWKKSDRRDCIIWWHFVLFTLKRWKYTKKSLTYKILRSLIGNNMFLFCYWFGRFLNC